MAALGDGPNVYGLGALRSLRDLELHLLVLPEGGPLALDGAGVHVDVRAVLLGDEPVALCALNHFTVPVAMSDSLPSWPLASISTVIGTQQPDSTRQSVGPEHCYSARHGPPPEPAAPSVRKAARTGLNTRGMIRRSKTSDRWRSLD